MLSINKLFCESLYCNKNALYCLKHIELKEPIAHAHLNPYVGPYSIDMFVSLIGASGFAQLPFLYCFRNQYSNAHVQQIKNEEDLH